MKTDDYWRRVPLKGVGESDVLGELVGCDDNLLDIVHCARAAGIREQDWCLIRMNKDYSDCYYEGDEPSIRWVFPLTVFDSF